jgi:nucleotide-binding universal stress UspA family protein
MTFDRIIVGFDGSPAALEALRQAKCLLARGGRLTAVTVCDVAKAAQAGYEASRAAAQLLDEARAAQADAGRELAETPSAEARIIEGRVTVTLLELAEREGADLIAVGTHGHRRALGIVLGSVATTVLHDAPCPVLIARACADPASFPRAVVVGLDGSDAAAEAEAVAQDLADRFGAALRSITAMGGKALDGLPARDDLELDDRHPVDVLVAASQLADLLVLGSRGLHGFAALGSVSERVAHRAECSVLVARYGAGRRDGVAAPWGRAKITSTLSPS